MPKTFNYFEAKNMTHAVCGSYLSREQINQYFSENFTEEKEFTGDEIKQVVHELMKEIDLQNDRITKRMGETAGARFHYKPFYPQKKAKDGNEGNER